MLLVNASANDVIHKTSVIKFPLTNIKTTVLKNRALLILELQAKYGILNKSATKQSSIKMSFLGIQREKYMILWLTKITRQILPSLVKERLWAASHQLCGLKIWEIIVIYYSPFSYPLLFSWMLKVSSSHSRPLQKLPTRSNQITLLSWFLYYLNRMKVSKYLKKQDLMDVYVTFYFFFS